MIAVPVAIITTIAIDLSEELKRGWVREKRGVLIEHGPIHSTVRDVVVHTAAVPSSMALDRPPAHSEDGQFPGRAGAGGGGQHERCDCG